jgi:hypothetical protein
VRSHIHSIFRIHQPVAICKLHMFSCASKFVHVVAIRKSAREESSSRIGDRNPDHVEDGQLLEIFFCEK